jgi:hypothetical protein
LPNAEELKAFLFLLLRFAGVAVFVWLYLKLNLFFYERGWIVRRSPKVEFKITRYHETGYLLWIDLGSRRISGCGLVG